MDDTGDHSEGRETGDPTKSTDEVRGSSSSMASGGSRMTCRVLQTPGAQRIPISLL